MPKALLSFSIGGFVSVAAIYFAFRHVPLADLLTFSRQVNYLWIGPAVVFVLASLLLRSLRWRVILGRERALRFQDAHHPLAIGFMLNCILPGRVGELARPALLYQRNRIPFTTGLATVAAERAFDIIMLLVLFILTLGFVQIDPTIDISFAGYHLTRATLLTVGRGMAQLSVVLLTGILLVAINGSRHLIQTVVRHAPRWIFFFAPLRFQQIIADRIGTRLIAIIENIATGFALVKHPIRLIICSGLTLPIWFLVAAAYFVMAKASAGVTLTPVDTVVYMVIICFFIALPSVPGYWGLWEAGGMFGLTLFGTAPKDAAGFTLMTHAIQLFPVMFVGLVSVLITGVNIWKTSWPADAPENGEQHP